jgi:hypothetical protein
MSLGGKVVEAPPSAAVLLPSTAGPKEHVPMLAQEHVLPEHAQFPVQVTSRTAGLSEPQSNTPTMTNSEKVRASTAMTFDRSMHPLPSAKFRRWDRAPAIPGRQTDMALFSRTKCRKPPRCALCRKWPPTFDRVENFGRQSRVAIQKRRSICGSRCWSGQGLQRLARDFEKPFLRSASRRSASSCRYSFKMVSRRRRAPLEPV